MCNSNDEMIAEGLCSPRPNYPIWIDISKVGEIWMTRVIVWLAALQPAGTWSPQKFVELPVSQHMRHTHH